MSAPPAVAVAARLPRAGARPALALVVVLLALAVILSGLPAGPSSPTAFAQATAPKIVLLNPDSSTSPEISAKSDTEDTTYHLVAWVSDAPLDAVVQFKYQADGEPELGITCADSGTADAVAATPDTYECDWGLAGVEDGAGTVRAELYSGGPLVAQDEEPVTVDHAGQTVEIVRPRQGEEVGFTRGTEGSGGTIDFKTSGPGTPSGDEGTQRVTVYYSTAAPGTEPVFTACGTKETTGGTQDSVRCDMAANDPATPEDESDPARVTAVAATAGDTDEGTSPVPCSEPDVPLCDQEDVDAADAHRVAGPPPPTPTASPTETGTPTQGPTTPPAGSDRTVSFSADRRVIVAGRRVVFSGRILSEDPSCADGDEFVRISRRRHGTDRYRILTGVNTDASGRFALRTRQKRNADYIAVAPSHDQCRHAGSSPVSVLVKVRIQIAASDTTPPRGEMVRIQSSVRPQHDRTKLILQRQKGRRWVRFMVARLDRRSVASFVFRAGFDEARFRTRWRSQSTANQGNTSTALRIDPR